MILLLLIRHAETVDNVAGLYAGTRDSALTNHGVEQARRLGESLAARDDGRLITHIFSSPLARTVKTAEAICAAQRRSVNTPDGTTVAAGGPPVEIVTVRELMEQDFGSWEGTSFRARLEPKRAGSAARSTGNQGREPGLVDVESKESMARRADAFLDMHLLPLLLHEDGRRRREDSLSVAVVSHGMLLSSLWKRLLQRLPRKSVRVAPEVTTEKGSIVLEHLGGWSNTGYLELALRNDEELERTRVTATSAHASEETAALPTSIKLPLQPEDATSHEDTKSIRVDETDLAVATAPRTLSNWSTTILAIDNKKHLVGLKRQRGGIGRLAYDPGQTTVEAFFSKRQRLG